MKSAPDTTLHTAVAQAAVLDDVRAPQQPQSQLPPAQQLQQIETNKPASSRVLDKLLIAGFFAIIMPLAALTFILQPDTVSTDENRDLAPMPRFHRKKVSEFPPQCEAFYNDRLAFRKTMVKLRNLAKYRVFGVSTGAEVAVGKRDFLFFMGDDMERVCKTEQPLTPTQQQDWVTAISERQEALAQRGIKYLFVLIPEKPSVYPEFVPAVLSPVREVSGVDQIELALSRVSPAKTSFLNLLFVQKAGKSTRGTYLTTDSHWTEFGAFLGYQAIIDRLRLWFPGLEPPLVEGQLKFRDAIWNNGDCPKLMGLAHWIPEIAPQAEVCDDAQKRVPKLNIDLEQLDFERTDADAKNLPMALIIHDSFGFTLKPFIYNHFRKVHFHRQSTYALDEKLLQTYKPDVVVQLLVERHMMSIVPNHSNDWRHWLKDKLDHPPVPGYKWVNVLPNTQVFNVLALKEIDLANAKATTSRSFTKDGDKFEFSPETAQHFDWYLVKSGDQGFKLADAASRRAYSQLQEFVQHSGKYQKAGEFTLPDKEVLTLYARKI